MSIRPIQPADRDEWLRMRRALWPDEPGVEADTASFFSDKKLWGLPTGVFVADRGDNKLAGFVEVSLRPAADGCISSPIGYIEGWYVEADQRRRGIGGQLIRAAERWAMQAGCSEMGSDCHAENHVSFNAHVALGYSSSERCTLLRKSLIEQPRATNDWIGLVPFGLNERMAARFVAESSAGGICIFAGTTRAETNAAGKSLIALDYEAYAEMAEKQLRDLASRARQRWPIVKLVLLHRLRRVPIAEASVLIAVSTPHRAESFEACRYLIDELKRDVAIWKKEVWEDGQATWVHPQD